MTYCEYSDNELDPVFSPLLTLNKFKYIQRVAQTNKIVEIVSTGRIAVTVIEGADTMGICKTTATPPVLTATVSKIHDIQQ